MIFHVLWLKFDDSLLWEKVFIIWDNEFIEWSIDFITPTLKYLFVLYVSEKLTTPLNCWMCEFFLNCNTNRLLLLIQLLNMDLDQLHFSLLWQNSWQKQLKKGRQRWRTPLMLTLGRQRRGGALWVWGQPGLQSEFYDRNPVSGNQGKKGKDFWLTAWEYNPSWGEEIYDCQSLRWREQWVLGLS